MQRLLGQITLLEQVECANAVKKWGYNHSAHEGYAVLREEVDEMQEEAKKITAMIEMLWRDIKSDSGGQFETAKAIKNFAIYAAAEAVQVAAMAQKFIDSEEKIKRTTDEIKGDQQ